MKRVFFLLTLVIAPASAHAYLPPAFFVYSRVTEQKAKNNVTGALVTVARPQSSGTEEILGQLSLSEWQPVTGGWPTLSLIFNADHEALIRSVTAFGLTVAPETSLLRVERERISAMKEAPRPFYKPDRTMSMKRARQTYAWVHSNAESGKSIWVEKDTVLPLKIAAPCPAAAASLSWAKSGENKCEIEFRNLSALRRGSFQSARLTLWKDGAPLLFFTFDKTVSGKAKLSPTDGKLPPDVREVAETVLH